MEITKTCLTGKTLPLLDKVGGQQHSFAKIPVSKSDAVGFTGVYSKIEKVTDKLANIVPTKWMEKLASFVPDKLLKNPKLHRILETADNNVAFFEQIPVLFLATTLRPTTILAVPGAPKEDRKYSAAQSIATGLLSFGIAAAIYIPLAETMSKLGKKALDSLCDSGKLKFPKHKSLEYKAFNTLVNYGSKFLIALPEAYLLFKALPIIKRKFLSDKKDTGQQVGASLAKLNLTKEQQEIFNKFLPKENKTK